MSQRFHKLLKLLEEYQYTLVEPDFWEAHMIWKEIEEELERFRRGA